MERRRRAAGLTQQQLAERSGVSVGVIRDLEQGRTARPRPGSADSLARALGLSDDDLAALTGHGPTHGEVQDSAAADGGIRLSVLGSLSVWRDGVVVALGGQRSRALLALLGVQPGCPVSRDAIIDALWGGAPPATAVNMVQSCAGALRRLLSTGEPAGQGFALASAGAGGYLLRATAGQLDLLECRDLGSRARAAVADGDHAAGCELFQQAAGLWRGDPVADVAVLRGHPAVTGLARERASLVLDYADAAAQAGWHERVVDQLRMLAEAEPLDERTHARLMIALAATGQQAAALSVFSQLSQRLSDELGVRPGPEFTDAHLRVLRGGPFSEQQTQRRPGSGTERAAGANSAALAGAGPGGAAAPALPGRVAPPRQLPPGVAHFTGRSGELAALTSLLEQAGGDAGTVVISAIGGMAGIGKTALAVHWAHQAAAKFPDGQLYANLRGFDPSGTPATPGEVIRGFLDALGIGAGQIPHSLDAQAGLYRSLLAAKKMLIVLDNAASEQQVRPLLPGSPGSLVLVTSRRQLAGLAAHEGARLLSLDVLTPAEGRDLLTARLGGNRATAEPEAVNQIISLCARLPLALAITAARATARAGLPLATLAAELQDAGSRLDALDAGDPTANVRAVFSWSYAQLPSPAARLFRLLGLHPGADIGVPAAASLAGIGPAKARQELDELSRAHLIAEHQPGRYAFHDLLRAYAAEQARAADSDSDRYQAIGRALDYYLHTAAAAARQLYLSQQRVPLAPPRPGAAPGQPADYRQALTWLEDERQVLLAAINLAAESGFDTHAWQIPWTMVTFLHTRGHYQEFAAAQHTALTAATRLGDIVAQAVSSRLLANAYADLGDHDQALDHFASSLALYHRLGDRLGQAKVHQGIGALAGRQGRYADALGHAEQALRLYQAVGDKAAEADALNNVGFAHGLLGDYRQADVFCRKSLTLCQELGYRLVEGSVWDSLGYVAHHLGNFAEAVACYQRALSLTQEVGNRETEATILTHLGDAHQAAGELSQARGAWQQALQVFDDLRYPEARPLRTKLAATERASPNPTA